MVSNIRYKIQNHQWMCPGFLAIRVRQECHSVGMWKKIIEGVTEEHNAPAKGKYPNMLRYTTISISHMNECKCESLHIFTILFQKSHHHLAVKSKWCIRSIILHLEHGVSRSRTPWLHLV